MTRVQEALVTRTSPRSFAAVGLAATLIALAAGCGGSSSGGGATVTTGGKVDSAAAAKVPASVKSKGTLTVAADATYAPNEFIGSDGHTVQGMDADLADALGEKLGLKVNVVNQSFDSIIPGI